MDNNSISFNSASGADSTSVQEQVVKGSLSSSNLNECEELEEVDLDFHKYDYRSGFTAYVNNKQGKQATDYLTVSDVNAAKELVLTYSMQEK